MLNGIAKAIAYMKAPVKTFALLHPIRATKLLVSAAIVGTAVSLLGNRSRSSRRRQRRRESASPQPNGSWTRERLYERAKELDIRGRSKMTKEELLAAVRRAA